MRSWQGRRKGAAHFRKWKYPILRLRDKRGKTQSRSQRKFRMAEEHSPKTGDVRAEKEVHTSCKGV